VVEETGALWLQKNQYFLIVKKAMSWSIFFPFRDQIPREFEKKQIEVSRMQ
jgi:hypothetical protein